jgi:two-component system sensor histidine kinase FlrB
MRGQEGRLALEVRDNGPGIPADVRERVFDPFFTTRASAGIGLGLFLVEGIVRAHAGSVTLGASGGQGGEGASFRLDLPLEVASDQGEGPATPLARVAAG